MIAQLVHEETALKIQKAKVAHENPFAREMETNEKEFAEFTARQIQVETEKREVELRIETLRQEAQNELEIAELKYQASLDAPQNRKLMLRLKSGKFRIFWTRVKVRFLNGSIKTGRDGRRILEKWWMKKRYYIMMY